MSSTSIDRLLIANRGEIARRIIRTCRSLGVETVAVFSDADALAPHVAEADVAIRLPGTAAADTYLRADLLIEVARRTGAQAIHPGYGFLSENAGFAAAVAAAGLVFVGPPASAIEAMGSKIGAKALMRAAGVPVLPDNTVESLDEIGLPALVKASAGGGGRGMRIVTSADDLADAIASAEREAAAAFGDGTVFVERYVEGGRHVEIQVFADDHGNVVSLFERDCSLQRRHQKVIEETPSTAVGPDLRARMSEAACAAARAVGYRGAGTVEFLLDRDGRFAFLEMNTRLQVEHPVTELVTGLDLVALQLHVAEGRALPPEALAPTATGHAIEARVCAEDPAHGYRPSSGRFLRVDWAPVDGVRYDSGIEAGSVVSPYYDSMVAKVIAHGPTREIAIRRLRRALRESRLYGPVTNRNLLLDLLDDLATRDDEVDTGFVERTHPSPSWPATELHHAAAAVVALHHQHRASPVLPGISMGWRNNPCLPQIQRVAGNEVAVHLDRRGHVREVTVDGWIADGHALAGHRVPVEIVDGVAYVEHGRWALPLEPRALPPDEAGLAGSLVAPMPGSVVRVLVEAGEPVVAGQALVVIEAMKMEHQIVSPSAGTVAEVFVTARQQLDADQPLLRIEESIDDEEVGS